MIVYGGGDEQVQAALADAQLDALERQLRAALMAIWRAQGKRYKIVEIGRVTYETKAAGPQ